MRHLFHHSGRDSTRGKQKGGAGKRPLSPLRQDAEQEPMLFAHDKFPPRFSGFRILSIATLPLISILTRARILTLWKFEVMFEENYIIANWTIRFPSSIFFKFWKGCWSGVMGKFYLYSRLVSSCNRYTVVGKSILFKKRR